MRLFKYDNFIGIIKKKAYRVKISNDIDKGMKELFVFAKTLHQKIGSDAKSGYIIKTPLPHLCQGPLGSSPTFIKCFHFWLKDSHEVWIHKLIANSYQYKLINNKENSFQIFKTGK